MRYWDEGVRSLLRPLKHCCHVNPAVLSETTDPDWEFDYIDIGSVSLSEGVTHKVRMRFAASPSRARKPVREGDILVSTVRTYLRAIAAVEPSDTPQVASTGFAVLRANKGTDARFLYRVVQSNPFVEQVVSQSTGVSYPAINPSTLSNIEVPLPDLATQRQIADFLDRETARIDLLIEKKQRLVALLGEKWESVVENAISTGGKWTKLGHHVGILSGYAFPSSDFSTDPADIPLLRGANVSPGSIRWDDTVYWSRERLGEVSRFMLGAGDVVLGMDRPWISSGIRIAELTEQDAPALLLQRVCQIEPRATLDKQFMKLLLTSRQFLAYFEPIMTGVSVPHISPDQVSSFRFEYVERDQQVRRATAAGRERERIVRVQQSTEKSIDRLKEYRSALITAAVTGQIDVTTYAKSGTPGRRLDAIQEEMGA
ncbi:restriction endonuclease subunit S [Flavimaricola sp.]|nr:restriction endonuclease subunit S [Flavimaricola sp.]MDA9019836.1 restriction endonuclease subunit S [Flavimaricola sp.]